MLIQYIGCEQTKYAVEIHNIERPLSRVISMITVSLLLVLRRAVGNHNLDEKKLEKSVDFIFPR